MLNLDSAANCVNYTVKFGHYTIAGRVEYATAMYGDNFLGNSAIRAKWQ
jgi:hypothetical protein